MQRESMTIVTLWRDGLSRACHSEKEIEAATADGFVPYNPKDHDYPRFLYSGSLSLKVSSAAEEKERAKEGWVRTPGADYVPEGTSGDGPARPIVPAPTTVVVPDDTAAILALLVDLTNRVAAVEAKLATPDPEPTKTEKPERRIPAQTKP